MTSLLIKFDSCYFIENWKDTNVMALLLKFGNVQCLLKGRMFDNEEASYDVNVKEPELETHDMLSQIGYQQNGSQITTIIAIKFYKTKFTFLHR